VPVADLVRRVGRATGRLDLLGGVADYSGALVLETPTVAATVVTLDAESEFVVGPVCFRPEELSALALLPYPEVRAALADVPKWTRYPIGVALVLVRHGVIEAPTGRLAIESDVPAGGGVSSSAALEVATARALGADLPPLELAARCQEAENEVVGAPCGIMDQVTVTAGEAGAILPILCRPASIDPAVSLPDGYEVVGWPTGATHDVSGVPYGRARAAAFMGKRIAEEVAGRQWAWVSETPSELLAALPRELSGREFLDRWGHVDDTLSAVDADLDYPVRAAASFGVDEHARSTVAVAALRRGDVGALAQLMAESHAGYDAMGLGHPRADAVVRQACSRPGVVGARSSGGGCGGTVAVLCEVGALDDVDDLIR